jgi:hypothetical protein
MSRAVSRLSSSRDAILNGSFFHIIPWTEEACFTFDGMGKAPNNRLWAWDNSHATDEHMWSDNKVRELIAVKVLHTSLLNITLIAFNVLHMGSCAPMTAPSPHFKTILVLVLWNGIQSCRRITPDIINVINMPSVQYFLYLRE